MTKRQGRRMFRVAGLGVLAIAVLTGAKGDFKLENMPPGKHRVEVWHPVLGTQSREVDVKPGQEVKLRFDLPAKS